MLWTALADGRTDRETGTVSRPPVPVLSRMRDDQSVTAGGSPTRAGGPAAGISSEAANDRGLLSMRRLYSAFGRRR